MEGVSRLVWELRNLQWDERNPNKPNKDSADGAHMTDALRYLAMGMRHEYRTLTEEREERARRILGVLDQRKRRVNEAGVPLDECGLLRDTKNREYGLERRAAIDSHRRMRYGYGWAKYM